MPIHVLLYSLSIVVEALEKARQPLPHLEAVYFMVPSEEVERERKREREREKCEYIIINIHSSHFHNMLEHSNSN